MQIQPGDRLGAYEILELIGAGGMGEVYRARDTRLGRSVAIKSLPVSFATDPQRVARFQREAQLLAALNHPNIAAIYGLEEAQGSQFLVLELVEGETLADRLKAVHGDSLEAESLRSRPRSGIAGQASGGGAPRGLSIDEALRIARQIADALEAAHEKGIIHRDLKPANIALTAEGQVKVLDFGLAKALDPDAASVAGGDLTHSPTLTFAATQAGMVLGTAAYMSPEQAKGKVADRRSDVWAFGCVLFEMLTGKRAFEGDDASDTLAAVLRGDPDWSAVPPGTPPGITRLVRRCLTKDLRERLRDIGDARFELNDSVAPSASASGAVAAARDIPLPAGRVMRALPWAVASLLAAALVATVSFWAPWRRGTPPAAIRLSAELGASAALQGNQAAAAALSADGQAMAFVASGAGAPQQLYVRRLDRLQATPLAGTDDAFGPFFSPDGQWVAFFAGGKLKKISVTGGSAITLCDAPNGRGGSWGDDDMIVFQPNNVPGSGLSRVSAAGGAPEALTKATEKELHRWPHVLPGARAVIYSSTDAATFADGTIVAQSLADGAAKVVQRGGYFGRYVTSGHLVYLHDGTLFAAPFDPDRLEVTGHAVPALERVSANPVGGGAQLAVSANGTLLYVPGESLDSAAPIDWLDRSGKASRLRDRVSNWSNPHFAPDGRRLALDISDGAQVDVWVYEWARDTLSRLTFDAADDQRPVWTPDGRRIAFSSRRGDKAVSNLYWQRADGTGDVQRLTESANIQVPGAWHPSGKFFAFSEQVPKTASDLMILPIEGDETTGWKPGTPTVFLSTPFTDSSPMFSPDGRWIAYISNESGRNEIYVRPFPGPGGKWQVSTGQADDPTWSPTRREFFYASIPDQRIMVAPYTVEGDSFRIEKPQALSDGRFVGRPRAPSRDLDLHPDGQRFAVAAGSSAATPVELNNIVFIFNFADNLRQLAAPSRD